MLLYINLYFICFLFSFSCENCPLACFCNESCRNSAQETFHKWECGGLEICYSIGIVHLALKVAILGMLDENKEKYKQVSDLVSHLDESNPPDVFNYAVVSFTFTYLRMKYIVWGIIEIACASWMLLNFFIKID